MRENLVTPDGVDIDIMHLDNVAQLHVVLLDIPGHLKGQPLSVVVVLDGRGLGRCGRGCRILLPRSVGR